jgi:hypothetical protein
MRVCDSRYHHDRLRCDVAIRFIEREARTRTIQQWTGLSGDRIRKLIRSYMTDTGGTTVSRHRGKSPSQVTLFLRSARARADMTLFASVSTRVGLVPKKPDPAVKRGPQLERGDLLWRTYDTYRAMDPTGRISFEQAVCLVNALTGRQVLAFSACKRCAALLVVERRGRPFTRCGCCVTPDGPPPLDALTPPAQAPGTPSMSNLRSAAVQSDLFPNDSG